MGESRSVTSRRRLLMLITVGVIVAGCASAKSPAVGMKGEALIGLAQQTIRACVGAPLREMSHPASTLLLYYREAALFEESFGGGKGSKPGYHHGCWATVLVEEGRVTGVEFRPVPHPDADTHECQEIFAACAP
jgi:hypothetical protein